MTALGIGVRVWIGWCEDSAVHERSRNDRLQSGTVTGGPYPPGLHYSQQLEELFNCKHVAWEVLTDAGENVKAAEYLLTPIDDGDETETTRNEEALTA